MSGKKWLLLLACCLLAGSAAAQTAKDAERTLRDAVVHKQLMLRGFNGDAEVRWRWDGNALVQQPPRLQMFAMLVADSVKVRGNKVEIKGQRRTLLRSSDTTYTLSFTADPVRVTVDFTGADATAVLPRLADMIFYPDRAAAFADTSMRPADADPKCCSKKVQPPLPACDCNKPAGVECSGTIGVTPPSLKSSVEPEFSEQARAGKFNGNVQVYLHVDTAGKPYDLWVMRPTGHGLDAKAVEAVSQYRFSPAACHGQPVPIDLYIDVNFQIF